MTALDVGKKLVALCRQGKNDEAIEQFYAKDIVSIEAGGPPGTDLKTEGKEKVQAKGKWWIENHEVHGSEIIGPFPNADKFALLYKIDVTFKPAKKRFKMEEIGVYAVKNGQIVREEFFYTME